MNRYAVSFAMLRTAGLAVVVAGWACQAVAHHPMGGSVPATFWQGLLSGLGHPIIELDHLLFLLGAGLAVAVVRLAPGRAGALLGTYATAGAFGTACQFVGVAIPLAEAAIAISLLAVAFWLWAQWRPGAAVSLVLAVAAGFFHGYAYGEAVIGAEATPLAAYLVGLALVQSLMMMAVYLSTRLFGKAYGAPERVLSLSRIAAVVLGAASVWSLAAGNMLV